MDEKATILIVEDDLDVADMLNAYFRVQGFEVLTVNWGEDGVRAAQASRPDIVILDIRLPDIDGFEVAKRLKANRRTTSIPIIFLTEKRERVDRLRGLELSAVDYITKPFDIQELRLKVRNTLQRSRQSTLTNPITGLPENRLVDEKLEACLQSQDWAIITFSLANLGHFREAYGFVAADDLLRASSIILEKTVEELGNEEDFLGQIKSTDFLLITRMQRMELLTEQCTRRLEVSFNFFYRDQDLKSDLFARRFLFVKVNRLLSTQCKARSLEYLKQQIERLNP